LAAVIAFLTLDCAGCSERGGRANPPKYSSGAGSVALAHYDSNQDCGISGQEYHRVPALLASLHQVDVNNDGKITADEIDARIKSWLDSRVGESAVRCLVLLDGTPLHNADILFEPEAFLGPHVQPAYGKTGTAGIAGISVAKEHLADPRFAGVANGWYKIRITSDTITIPARYNTETTLGCEVAADAHWVGVGELRFDLRSD
jgi:hypothetical protein